MALPFRNKIVKVVVLYLALVIVLIDSTPAIKRVMEPRTNDLEFQYLVKSLPLLPDKAQVYYPEPDVDSGFYGYRSLNTWQTGQISLGCRGRRACKKQVRDQHSLPGTNV